MRAEPVLGILQKSAGARLGLSGTASGAVFSGAKRSIGGQTVFDEDHSLRAKKGPGLTAEDIRTADAHFVGRFGLTEFWVLLRAQGRTSRPRSQVACAPASRLEAPVWIGRGHSRIQPHSGFCPVIEENIERFVALMAQTMGNLGLHGSWALGANQLRERFPKARITSLRDLSPFGKKSPWTSILEVKPVLVIGSSKVTIERRFDRPSLIFNDGGFVSVFDLRVARAARSLGNHPPDHPRLFDALNHMLEENQKGDFDVAPLECGASGFPFGPLVGRDGQKAVVFGGLVQLLFGIIWTRWDMSRFFKEYWVGHQESEKPDCRFTADGGDA